MWRTYSGFVVLGVALLVVLFAANARADLLFSDNFDGAVSTGADYGLNQNLDTRESGDHAGVGWVLGTTLGGIGSTWPSAARVNYSGTDGYGVADALTMNNIYRPNQTVLINHSFTDAAIIDDGGFTVRFDCAPLYTSSQGGAYPYGGSYNTAVAVGGKQYQQSAYVSNKSGNYDRSIFFRPTGSFMVKRVHNTTVSQGVYDASRPSTTDSAFTCPIYTFELRVATTSIASGEGATGWLYVGPQGTGSSALTKVNLNAAGQQYMTWTWDSDNTNYIMFSLYISPTGTWANNSVLTVYNLIDNVSVWSAMGTPEPSTLILLGMGVLGLLAYAWRRRRK